MPLPFLHRPGKPGQGLGGDFARRVAESLASSIASSIARLSTADKNRVLLALTAWIATQLEALEANNDTWGDM
jgi:hypothetical protein